MWYFQRPFQSLIWQRVSHCQRFLHNIFLEVVRMIGNAFNNYVTTKKNLNVNLTL